MCVYVIGNFHSGWLQWSLHISCSLGEKMNKTVCENDMNVWGSTGEGCET